MIADAAVVYRAQAFYGDRLAIQVAAGDFSSRSCAFYFPGEPGRTGGEWPSRAPAWCASISRRRKPSSSRRLCCQTAGQRMTGTTLTDTGAVEYSFPDVNRWIPEPRSMPLTPSTPRRDKQSPMLIAFLWLTGVHRRQPGAQAYQRVPRYWWRAPSTPATSSIHPRRHRP